MKNVYFLGLDIGTGGCRAALFSLEGQLVSLATREYPLLQPKPGWAEQDPKKVYESACWALKECVRLSGVEPTSIVGLGLSSVFHSLVLLDRQGNCLSNALIWADNRSLKQAEFLKADDDGFRIYSRTGCRVHPMYPLAKILWFKEETPDIFQRAAKFVSLKEYVVFRLLGRLAVDQALASTSGLLNIHSLRWDEECLELLGIKREQLSELIHPQDVVGRLKGEIARELGLQEGLPVVIGAGDGMLSNLGSGAYGLGQVVAMVGTSGAIRVFSEKPLIDAQGRTWCYAFTDKCWVVGGAINNGGIIYRWFRDNFAEKDVEEARRKYLDPYEILNELAAKVGPGAGGLIFLPFLTGERSPYWNPEARGVIFGLSLHHGKPHMVRALMEGVIFRMYSVFEAILELVGRPQEVRAAGGFTRSPLWCQIMADVFGYPIKVPEVSEASAFGAAVMAMWGLGFIEGLEAVRRMVKVRQEMEPQKEAQQVYTQLYKLYRDLYFALREYFPKIASFQRQHY